MKFGFTPEAEILNARLAMIGFIAAVGAYFTTGKSSQESADVSSSSYDGRIVYTMVSPLC